LLVDQFVDVPRCLALLSGARIDGALVDWLIPDTVLQDLLGHHVPIVLVGRPAGDLAVNWVAADEEGGAYQATRHLTDLGHRHLGMISALGPQKQANAQTRQREAGFRRAGAEMGLLIDPRAELYGDWTFRSGFDLGTELLLRRPRPTALYVLGEYMAAGVLEAAAQLGMNVPDDVAIVAGQGTLLAAVVRPRLTTVHVPIYEVGLRATELLLALLDNPASTPRQIVLPTTLVVGESSVASASIVMDRAEPGV
jgi:DNA-binding LacI/PurR family transcriptional regulator